MLIMHMNFGKKKNNKIQDKTIPKLLSYKCKRARNAGTSFTKLISLRFNNMKIVVTYEAFGLS